MSRESRRARVGAEERLVPRRARRAGSPGRPHRRRQDHRHVTAAALLRRNAGAILVNGVDIRRLDPVALRRLFAIVQQDIFLFTGNVAAQHPLGDPAIGHDTIRTAAARGPGPDRFISRLPGGYPIRGARTWRGTLRGEKQLLSFARALAFDPPVLILDEATSSIDTETELLIQDAIQTLLRGRTSSSSPTASPPSAPPTRSWSSTTARSASAAPTRN